MMTRSAWLRRAPRLLALLSVLGCGTDADGDPQRLAVLSAFPAELAAVLAHTAVEETRRVAGRTVRLGRIAGVPVVVAMTGIGLRNAAATTAALLAAVPVVGVVVAGVAGSPLRIGDVVVPASWAVGDAPPFAVDAAWLARAARLAASGGVALERCTTVRGDPVCLGFTPSIVVGGGGSSADSFGDQPFPCQPNGGEVFGCDVAAPAAVEREPIAVDMETAAIAREAHARGLPFIAFRAVSDGAEDPLDLPGFPSQFFAYYPLAAENAARAAAAFVADAAE